MTSPVVLVLDDVQGDTAFGQQFLDIPVGQPVPQVPADASEITSAQGEPEACEHRSRAMCNHRTSLQPPAIDKRNSARDGPPGRL
jgi:hypothetical protein